MSKVKVVDIWIDTLTREVCVAPDPVHVSFSAAEAVVWRCLEGSAAITFSGDTPFREKTKKYHVPRGGSVSTGAPATKFKVRGDAYKYEVEVTLEDANCKQEKLKKDPEVIVDP